MRIAHNCDGIFGVLIDLAFFNSFNIIAFLVLE